MILADKKAMLQKDVYFSDDPDVFSVMIWAGSMNDVEHVDHATTLVAAGQITTAFVLSCLIFELSRRADLQIKIQINAATERSSDVAPTPVLEAVILEALRFYPSIDCTPRVCLKSSGNSTVPKWHADYHPSA